MLLSIDFIEKEPSAGERRSKAALHRLTARHFAGAAFRSFKGIGGDGARRLTAYMADGSFPEERQYS